MNAPVWSRDYLNSPLSHPRILRSLRVRFKVISGCDEPVPMLVRYRLFDTPWGSLNIHRFMRSDHDRALHDHPFAFVSIILSGSYLEHTPKTGGHGILRLPFDVLFRRATWTHRVELIGGQPCWTLIWIGKKSREWGFHTAHGWLNWRRYHATAGCAGEEAS